MSKHIEFKPIESIGSAVGIVNSFGIQLQIGSDFEEFRRISEIQPLKPHVNPAFNPDYCDLANGDAFWMIGFTAAGEIVQTQAMKLIDVRESTLEKHLETNFHDFRSHGYDFDMDRSYWCLSNNAANITGRISYHGELWIKGGPNGFRGGCLATILTRLMLITGMQIWSPDYMIGLQSPMTSCRGLACREGYMQVEQRSMVWQEKNDNPPQEDWLVWMSREEAEFNLRLPPQMFYDLFESSRRPKEEGQIALKTA